MRRTQLNVMSLLLCAGLVAACSSDGEAEPPATTPVTAVPSSEQVEGEGSEPLVTNASVPATDPDADEAGAAGAADDDEQRNDARYASGDPTVLFDPEVVHTFQIDLPEESLAELDADPTAEEYVEGSLTFDGETIERVGVRYKGSIGAFVGCTSGPNPLQPTGVKTCTKLSMKLKINWDGADTEFYGQRRVQLHSMRLDESMLRDRLGYEMFRQMGVPAPRSTHARVEVNGEFVGVFALVEQVDGRFTRDRFDDGTGNLYKEVWPFDLGGEVQSADDLTDGLETNEDDDPPVDIIQSFAQELLDAGASTDAEAARRVLGERTDLEALVSYAVVDRAIGHDDGPFHWYCFDTPCEPHNFFIYEEPDTRRIHMIPWDLDNAFSLSNPVTEIADPWGETRNDCQPFPHGPISLPQVSAGCDPFVAAWALLDTEYARIDDAFRAGPFAPDNVRALLDTWAAQIEPLVIEAAEVHDDAVSIDRWNAARQRIIDDFAVPTELES